ncbi:MAG TPA: Panacea domain-containing protein [Pyrinomonadaceae bacterium]|nr:Panacea domain-containing protein [Pyrinomonadaceae bacterium]
MKTGTFSHTMHAQRIDRVANLVQIFFKTERDAAYPTSVIKRHIENLVETRGECILDDDGELLMLGGSKAAEELERLLGAADLKAWAEPKAKAFQPGLFEEKASRFNGFRLFSPERINAMIVHLAYKGNNLKPTRLNKLLFYSDFSYFRKRSLSISGAEYVALKHGPVFGNYDNEIRILEKKKEVRVKKITARGKPARIILPKKSYRPEKSILSKEEIGFLDWVVEKYDHLTTDELIAQSHREDAFWDSHFGELISYEYAESLVIAPPDSLLDH